jgi:antitoxin component YwqK of YwqJK toxin-antitoxin module
MKEVITTFDNGKVKEKYFVNVNGKKDGEYIEYHENGNVHIKCNYHNGKLEGEYILYYENGNVSVKCNLHDGYCEGEYICYYGNGNVKVKCNYHYNKEEGEYFEYNVSNQLIKHRIYENGYVTKYLLGEYTDSIITLVENDVKK